MACVISFVMHYGTIVGSEWQEVQGLGRCTEHESYQSEGFNITDNFALWHLVPMAEHVTIAATLLDVVAFSGNRI